MPYVLNTRDVKHQDMPTTELKIVMQRKGVTQKEIADRLNVSRQAVNLVVNHNSTSHRIREAIAEAIDIDLKRIWPSAYLMGGGPRKPGRPANCQKAATPNM
jgi:lambda repressor-like predicted transcriptional regulator